MQAFFILFVLSVIGEVILGVESDYWKNTIRRWVDELIPALLAKEPIFKRIRECLS